MNTNPSPIADVAREPGYTTLIAHRGESDDAPENTLPAYKMAVERGFGFECDLYLSADGRIFTFHDKSMTRTTGGADTRKCEEVTWDEVSKVDVGGWGKWKGSKFVGTRPALLEEVLALARDGRRIYLEVKSGPAAVPVIARILTAQRNAHPGNVLFITFHEDVCSEIKRLMPSYTVYWLTSWCRKTESGERQALTAAEVVETLERCGADGVDMEFNAAVHDAKFIRTVHDAGRHFHAWVSNWPGKTLLAFCRGVETVTTDCARRQLEAIRVESSQPW